MGVFGVLSILSGVFLAYVQDLVLRGFGWFSERAEAARLPLATFYARSPMTTERRSLLTAALLAPFAFVLRSAHASEHSASERQHKEKGETHVKPQFLFVQSAEGVTYSQGRLTLKGVGAITTVFSDRPERIAGHMKTASFVPFWSEGADSFASDPPNATLSVLEGEQMGNSVLELRNPQLAGRDLTYEVSVLEGMPPATGGPASLFIDMIGMPLTPVSFAGADRRMWRRAYY